MDKLIIHLGIQFLPLYINSFLKLDIFSDNLKSEMINRILYITNKSLREPIFRSIKFLYPIFYRIDNIEKGKYDINNENKRVNNIGLINEEYNIIQKPLLLRLSKDVIYFDCAYLIDDGTFIYIFIFNKIDIKFYQDLFNVNTFEEAKNLGNISFNQDNESELNQRLLNIFSQIRNDNDDYCQPIRIFFWDENCINIPIINEFLKEDKLYEFSNYSEYLCTIHQKIQQKMDEY